jgi:predicted enzyme related to lactoylglutathione lyase
MKISKLSTCIITDKIEETKYFYSKILKTKITFDCGWYCSICFEGSKSEIQFMTPQKESDKLFLNQGVTYNICVEDVDFEYAKIVAKGVTTVDPIEDHPWGDRSFVILDPNDVRLYIYSDRELAEEFLEAVK